MWNSYDLLSSKNFLIIKRSNNYDQQLWELIMETNVCNRDDDITLYTRILGHPFYICPQIQQSGGNMDTRMREKKDIKINHIAFLELK